MKQVWEIKMIGDVCITEVGINYLTTKKEIGFHQSLSFYNHTVASQ
jgi:hypothetical protein